MRTADTARMKPNVPIETMVTTTLSANRPGSLMCSGILNMHRPVDRRGRQAEYRGGFQVRPRQRVVRRLSAALGVHVAPGRAPH